MKWDDFRRSDNIEDRRGDEGGGMSVGGGGLGLGTIVILGLIGYMTGIDPRILIGGAQIVTGGGSHQTAPQSSGRSGAPDDRIGQFVSAVLAQNEDVWSQILPGQKNIRYVAPKLVLFSGATRSACGGAESAMGPFYCPLDQKVYLDTAFFQEMQRKLGGGGEFAYAYVIAHEVGHHVQNVMGILPKVQDAQKRSSQQQANALSVRVELMADCLAGVWAANADQKWRILEQGDVERALSTAKAIGDDTLQRASRGSVVPDSFTHGSSEQRQRWLTTGLKSGRIDDCNTFAR